MTLSLPYNLTFPDLYTRRGLVKLDKEFVRTVKENDIALFNRLVEARATFPSDQKTESELLLALAPHLEHFIANLFSIEKELADLVASHHTLAPLYSCKRLFVQRQAAKKFKPEEASTFDGPTLETKLGFPQSPVPSAQPLNFELSFATQINEWEKDKTANAEKLDTALRYAAWALYSKEGIEKHKAGILFKQPHKLDPAHLVPVETIEIHGVTMKKLPHHMLRHREGFALTDQGGTLIEGLDDANYCIWCHHQGKDSCSKGLKEKDGSFKQSASGVTLAGCPLEEKISEMHELKSQAIPIGALGIITIDNPMCAATGHRICNDCMKACVYQKQEPVNIPRSETRILQDVLDLPWGFEIYSLLTRWNPLNLKRPLPKKESGYKVLVAGLGPAGYTLAHHLLNDGHTIIAVDGLKIEPLPSDISGVTETGKRKPFRPIKFLSEISEPLESRKALGFGGVAEYGITVRWNKNYLTLIRLLLERRNNFAMFGGVRFGSTLTLDDAWKLGFDHVALAMGAGKPTLLNIPNALANGVRTASDFLMGLQLSGAARANTIANLEMRLPVVVIGGGLTAVDTATEALAYYPVQVEKFLRRYEALVSKHSEEFVRASWSEQEKLYADEFITHARAIRLEKDSAAREGRTPNVVDLINDWGGVTVAYRKDLTDAPSYRLNHEEVAKAMEEGIQFLEHATPLSVEIDSKNNAKALKVKISPPPVPSAPSPVPTEKFLPARSIFVAAGTAPNTTLAREDGTFKLNGKYFQAINDNGDAITPVLSLSKPATADVLMHRTETQKYVSFFGDLHPSFFGNVVKAMGAAKQGYPVVSRVLARVKPASELRPRAFIKTVRDELIATVHAVHRLTPNIVEIVVKAPAAARRFEPGQFYRLQNFETHAKRVTDNRNNHTILAMEGLALTGAWVDKKRGLLSTIVLEMGGSSNLCAHLKPKEPIVLMGPTGAPTHITENETVMLVGGGLGNAVLFSIGKALREKGSKVLYVAGYKKSQDRYKVKEIEAAADVIIWACDEAIFTPERPQDFAFHGNIVQAILAYAEGRLGKQTILTTDVDRIIAIGSDRMMDAVKSARHTVLKNHLKPKHEALGSINSPMQCMMKEICAQCLQRHVDPVTGEERYVYSCFNQDQCLDHVDFPHLRERLSQNTLTEKLTKLWIEECLGEERVS